MVSLKLLSTTAMTVYKGLQGLHQIFYGPMLRNMATTDGNIFKNSDCNNGGLHARFHIFNYTIRKTFEKQTQ